MKRLWLSILILGVIPTAAAFLANQAMAGPVPHEKTGMAHVSPLPVNVLMNTTYYLADLRKTIKLTKGKYEENSDPGNFLAVTLEYAYFGDVLGNGIPASIVFLSSNAGGSASLWDMAIILNRKNKPYNVATVAFGDRVKVDSLSVHDKKIYVAMLVHAPEDALCCPTVKQDHVFALQGKQLVELPSFSFTPGSSISKM